MSWLGINSAGAKFLEMVAVYVNINKYGTLNDKDILMRKLAIYEFGCRNVSHVTFESLSIYYLYQKKLVELVETMYYSEMVKQNILIEKIKAEKEKTKKEVWMKQQCRNGRSSSISLGN